MSDERMTTPPQPDSTEMHSLESDFMQPNPPQETPPLPPNQPQRNPQQPVYPPPIPPQPPVRFSPDTERMLALPPIYGQEAESCRHQAEKGWYVCLIVLNILMILSVISAIALNLGKYQEKIDEVIGHVFTEEETDDSYYEDLIEDMPTEIQLFGYGIALLLFGYLSLYYMHATIRSRSIRITPRNFPEVHALIVSYAQRLGMQQVPEAFIMQDSGVLNALSSFLFKRQYIQINAELFEAAYREHHDINALGFVIAHEISHIYYGHATLHYNLPIWFSMNLPFFGTTASRAREYSCDRLAQRLTNYDGFEAMLILMVDRHLYKMVDKQDYLNHAVNERGFFIWLVNLLSSHPIMPKRIIALALWYGSGELF